MHEEHGQAGPVIEMQDVAVGSLHDVNTAVAENISWKVEAGEFWVIAGLQGSGKSDFLMMTGGVIAPLHGSYRLFGEHMPIFEEARLKQRLRLGLVFDGGQLFNHLTVQQNIALPLRYHHNLSEEEAVPEVTRFLEAMDLAPWADSTPGALGRNWQQRVGLARALVLKPEILLVDSPLAGLDWRHVHWWLDFLGQLSKGHALVDGRPMTVVATTADPRQWSGHAGHFVILRDKKFTVAGLWHQLESASDLLRELMPRPPGG